MAKTASELGELVDSRRTESREELARLTTLQKRIEGKLVRTWMPDNADAEYRDLFRKASSPWLAFVRDAIAQGMQVDGYDNERVWREVWQASGMDGRQGAINREVVGLGKSFIAVLPGKAGGAAMRPLSALQTFAVYADPWDEYPAWVISRLGKKAADFWKSEWLIVDDVASYRFNGSARAPENLAVAEHELGYCPVVQVSNTLGTFGQPESSVEAAVPVYQRIVDATFTLQMLQRYGAFPQKWMAGGEIAKDANGNALIRSAVDGLLHASGDAGESARFGTFAASDLTQAVAAVDAHIKHLSALVQVPPHYLLGAIANMSAEGIAAAESGYFRNIGERKASAGEGYELALRTGAAMIGENEAADDLSSQVHWADVSTRSLGQISDAVVKLATVGAPLELLFAMVPGWTKTDVLEASKFVRELPPRAIAADGGGVTAPDSAGEATQLRAQFDALGVGIRAGADPADVARRVGLDGIKFTGAVPVALRLPQSDAAQLEQQ